ncbi:MAG: Lpg1974 family pore-forming outer membrane protein [Tatlockia sp.]|jgi:hypothetical protein
MFKKTTLAIIALLLNKVAFAGTMGPVCTPGDVTVPCEATHWDIGAQALYLQSVYSADKEYEFNPQGFIHSMNQKWGFGYRLEGSYHFYMGNDVTMTYINYDKESHRFGFAGAIPFAFAFEPSSLKIENQFDQANLVLGQHVDISARKQLRFYGGLQYAKIRVDTTDQFTTVPTVLLRRGATGIAEYRDTDFNGFGPAVGIDYNYNVVNGLSLTANSAFSLLYGTNRYNSGFIVGPSGAVFSAFQHSQKTVVPSFEGKLGLKYSQDCAQGTLNLEGGFQALNYFNALETRRFYGLVQYHHASNFALYGPYLGAKWVG